jgi:hypothetical protein
MSPLRIGNASGFYGDRYTAVAEMLGDGPLDVLTGDYLAELTMLILGRQRLSDPATGYARTFLRQMRDNLALARERGVRIVANAGGLNPAGLAAALTELGTGARVAYVDGDDLLPHAESLNLPGDLLTANLYLGAWGIATALKEDADVVVTGRVTDASLVVGPAAAHFGWGPDDLDALAGATVAGHVLECGAQATGGNFPFFTEIAGPGSVFRPGFPLAEISADGASVITKHPGTGGAVTVDTVTAQLLYEIGSPRYAGPDVTARFDTITLDADGPDRVRIHGVRGEPPPPRAKVCTTAVAGFRNELTLVLTGLDIEAKAELVRRQLLAALPALPDQVRVDLARTDHTDAATQQEAAALLRITVSDPDPTVVGTPFSRAAVELGLASYPGFTATALPGDAHPYGRVSSCLVPARGHAAVLPDGTWVPVSAPLDTREPAPVAAPPLPEPLPAGPTSRAPLGRVLGARSGDKGGTANVGVWARDDTAWRWLAHLLTPDTVRALLPEAAVLDVRCHLLPNLRAVNVELPGLLGEGVPATTRFDPQAKGLAEWLRSRLVDVPQVLL